MTLNHLNLTVVNPTESSDLLVKYFGLKPKGKANANMAILADDRGMVLTLMSPRVSNEAEVRYPGAFHIGFVQDSAQQVNDINRRLRADGFDVPAPSRQHGSWTFYFDTPGGFTIEVFALGSGQFTLAPASEAD